MCRELMIISSLKKKDLKKIMKDYVIEGEVGTVTLGCMDDEVEAANFLDMLVENEFFNDYSPTYLIVFDIGNRNKYHLEFKKLEEETTK